MPRTTVPSKPSAAALFLLLAVGACGDADTSIVSPELDPAFSHQPADPGILQELAALRRATAPLHRVEAGMAAGWDAQVTECVEHPTEGGMGYHYGNFPFYLDGEANVLEPEVLIYEPREDGELHLVAVEYLVPFFAWAGDPAIDDPPRLFGRNMKRDDAQGEWVLHVWAWKHNPNGMFEDWNPSVSCEHAG